MTTPDGPPAGWYDDGVTAGVERWFDGTDWTEHTRPLAATPPSAPAAAAPVAAAAAAAPVAGAVPVAGTVWQPGAPIAGWTEREPSTAPAAAAGWGGGAPSSRFGSAPAAPGFGGTGFGVTGVGVAGSGGTPAGGARSAAGVPQPWGPAAATTWGASAPASYAHWGWRVLAYLLDDLVVSAPYLVAVVAAFASGPVTWTVDALGRATPVYTETQGGIVMVGVLAMFVTWIVNRGVLQARTGASLGKRAVRLRLVSEATDAPLSVWMCLVRDVGHVLDNLVLGLGWLWPLWDRRRQTFADKAVKAVVVRDA